MRISINFIGLENVMLYSFKENSYIEWEILFFDFFLDIYIKMVVFFKFGIVKFFNIFYYE